MAQPEKFYKHNFNNGDIVRDTEHNETFVFEDRVDGYRAQFHSEHLRLATEEEKKAFNS
jgi:capsule polysaccharide modification protein KpsS